MTTAMSAQQGKELAQQNALPQVRDSLQRVQLIQHILKEVMVENTHYGASFPGDKKVNLLKPGADVLSVAFGFAPEFQVTTEDLGNGHKNFTVTCFVKMQQTGMLVATGVGSCSTMESKYRWRNDKRECPDCRATAIIKGKAEYGGGWLCYKAKGGCGKKWEDGDLIIEAQPVGKVENPDPADQWNTCLKIGKKRAFVDATITATAASDMFTQDLEDIDKSLMNRPAPAPTAPPAPKPADATPKGQEAAPVPAAEETPASQGAVGVATQAEEDEWTATMKNAQSLETLNMVWSSIDKQPKGKIPANMLVRLMKVKREAEAALSKA